MPPIDLFLGAWDNDVAAVRAALLAAPTRTNLIPARDRWRCNWRKGWTALVWAAFGGKLALVRSFLDHGADASVRPSFAGRGRSLVDFLKEVAEPPPRG